jgi:chromosome segregation ATPase
MIADMAKYIGTLREKGRALFNTYLALKKHLEELRYTIERLVRENDQKKQLIAQVREEMENWKSKARDLQGQLDDLKIKTRNLEQEHKVRPTTSKTSSKYNFLTLCS